jgi:hypothetical protein
VANSGISGCTPGSVWSLVGRSSESLITFFFEGAARNYCTHEKTT